MKFKQALTSLPQYILPHHPLSRLMDFFTRSKLRIWKNFAIKLIVNHYKVNMDEASNSDITSYPSFNAFFTRTLKPGARPITNAAKAIVSPADGAVSQFGDIIDSNIIQAKGKNYTVTQLLGGDQQRAEPFVNGKFMTIYLSPRDYHRLHMPLAGQLQEMVHIPGRLFSVNAATTNCIPGLFARNERVATLFDTEAGPMALVLVGAIFVSSIETVWHGVVTPPTSKSIKTWQYPDKPPTFKAGEEMGRFNMGSTIIVLFGQNQIDWHSDLIAGKGVQLGQMIGKIK